MSTIEELKKAALEYHRKAPAGKIKVTPKKPVVTQRELSLAYSPGVAAACEEVVRDPAEVATLTARSNLVAVITNGTAVLGLGNIGPLAGKPVMEGKGVLFQKFAGIDVFDIEIAETDPDKLVDIIAALEPTFGGINLEDIKAPECFEVERKLRARMNIPVFHDDQHGTAIIVGAALVNALHVLGKDIGQIKLAASGAGAAGIACLDMLVSLGVKRENITVADKDGIIYDGRPNLDHSLIPYARKTQCRTLADAVKGADVFLGLSAGGVLKPEMVATMVERPVIFALANPYPEIEPEDAKKARPHAIIATGRSDYLIPRPFDPRLLISLAPAVAEAAVASGVATRPITDMAAYREHLSQFVYRTGLLMKPMFDRARADIQRVVYAEGEEETVLRAVQTVVDDQIAKPILIGRPSVIESRIKRMGLRLRRGIDFELTNPDDDPRFNDYWQMYHQIMQRKGVSPPAAKAIVRSRSTVIAALMVKRGEADAMLCGLVGKYNAKLKHVVEVLGLDP